MRTLARLVVTFLKGTVGGGLLMAFAGFVGFGLLGLLLQYFGQEKAWPIALNGARGMGLLGLLGGGLASLLHAFRTSLSPKGEPPTL